MDPNSIISLVLLVVLLLLSAFFSSAETALTTVNRIKILTLVEEGNKKAKRTLSVIDRPKKMLSAILIGNNIVNLSASSLATILATKFLGNKGAGIATGILTLLILIFGEITPKRIASIESVKLSMRYAPAISALMWVLTPVINIVNALSIPVIKLLGADPDFKDDVVTEAEIRTMVDASVNTGDVAAEERILIHKVFDFTDATAKEVMIPRIDMATIDVTSDYDQVMDVFAKHLYTRYPVYEGDSDQIIGLINVKDLILVTDKGHFSIRDFLRPVYYTYEQKNVADLFGEMRKESASITIVLDEYGSLSGMISLEDLLEEIVGEIRDEYDEDEEDPIVSISENEYIVLGSLNLEDLCNELPLGFESEDYDTIGGYLTGAFDHFPVVGETYVSEGGITLRVEEVDDKRIAKIRIFLPAEERNTED